MTVDASADRTEVRGILVPAGEENILLPSVAVADVLAYRDPAPYASSPTWLPGSVSWYDCPVPVVSLLDAAAEGTSQSVAGYRARLVICYTLNGNPALPYLAFVALGPPRLARFRVDTLRPETRDTGNPLVLHTLRFADSAACIPDLDAIESATLEVIGVG